MARRARMVERIDISADSDGMVDAMCDMCSGDGLMGTVVDVI